MNDLCFIDIETTGTLFGYHEIIEIGIIRTDNSGKNILEKFETKINPEYPERITDFAKNLNGFNYDDWKTAPKSEIKIWREIIKRWEGCFPVCHNPSFERAFITLSCLKLKTSELKLDYHWIGTESLSWPLLIKGKIEKLSLPSLAAYFKIENEQHPHRAITGANLCRKVYLELIRAIKF